MKEEKEEAHWYVIDGAHSGFSNTMISYAQMIWPHLQPPTENRGSGWPQWWRFLRESGLAENQSSPDNVRSIWEVNVANICHPHTSNLLLSTLLLLTQQVPSGRAGLNGWKKKNNLKPKWRDKREWEQLAHPSLLIYQGTRTVINLICVSDAASRVYTPAHEQGC